MAEELDPAALAFGLAYIVFVLFGICYSIGVLWKHRKK